MDQVPKKIDYKKRSIIWIGVGVFLIIIQGFSILKHLGSATLPEPERGGTIQLSFVFLLVGVYMVYKGMKMRKNTDTNSMKVGVNSNIQQNK